MARTFRRQRHAQPIADLNVTNLIDLGFTLLIIFMIATPLINQEQTIPVNLPQASKTPQMKVDSSTRFVAVSIDAQDRFYIDEQPVPVPLGELRERLRGFASRTNPPVIRIRGDGKVPYARIIQLMDELQKANLLKFTFDDVADSGS
jgi:biopolymer transport protein ExbD